MLVQWIWRAHNWHVCLEAKSSVVKICIIATWSRGHSFWCIHAILDSCLSFSAFQPDRPSSPKDPAGCCNSDPVDASAADRGMVSNGAAHVGSSPCAAATSVHHAAPGSPDATSATPPEAGCHSSVRRSLQADRQIAYQRDLRRSSSSHGSMGVMPSTRALSESGTIFAISDSLIHSRLL